MIEMLNDKSIIDSINIGDIGWFRYYIKSCTPQTLNAIKYNFNKFIKNKNSEGIIVDIIIEYVTDGRYEDYLSDYEFDVLYDYSYKLGKKFEDVFFPLYIKTYKKIIKSKDPLLYLMFSKYDILFDNDNNKYIISEYKQNDGYQVKTFNDVTWFYDDIEFKDDLFDIIIRCDWEETLVMHPLILKDIKHLNFVEDFCINLLLLNDLFVEELKNFD